MSAAAFLALSALGIYGGGVAGSIFIGFLELDSWRFWANAQTHHADLRDEWRERAEECRVRGLRRIFLAPLWPGDAWRYLTSTLRDAREGVAR